MPSRFDTCPDETLLAAFADGTLPGRQRSTVAAHAAGCQACLGAIAMLARLANGSAPAVDPALLERGREAGRVASRRHRVAVSVATNWRVSAAAALLLCAAGGALLYPLRVPAGLTRETSLTRGNQRTALPGRVMIRSPHDGDVLAGDVSWDDLAPATAYLVSVTGEDGTLIWQTTVRKTTTRVAAALEPGEHYYVMVKALLPDGKSIPGRAVRFRAP